MGYIWGHDRRFNAYTNYMRDRFGERVQKLTIDAGFTCPNRDGTVGTGGCTYCNNDAFNPSYCTSEKPITQQLQEGVDFHLKRYREATKYLAYFQAYSNTYAPVNELEGLYRQALNYKDVIGIVLGTRPDCIDDEKLEMISDLAKNFYIIIEYGIESCYNKTLERINRGHTYEQAVQAVEKTAQYGIKTGAHIILGLPGETKGMWMDEARILSKLPLNNLKIHQLQIVKETLMEKEYNEHPERFQFYRINEYIELVIDFIELLNPEFIVERISGETVISHLAGPRWGNKRYYEILDAFEKRMKERDTWQGRKFYEESGGGKN